LCRPPSFGKVLGCSFLGVPKGSTTKRGGGTLLPDAAPWRRHLVRLFCFFFSCSSAGFSTNGFVLFFFFFFFLSPLLERLFEPVSLFFCEARSRPVIFLFFFPTEIKPFPPVFPIEASFASLPPLIGRRAPAPGLSPPPPEPFCPRVGTSFARP